MGELDRAIFGSIDDVLFFDTPDLARADDDEQFERWLATVPIRDFERILDDLLADSEQIPQLSQGLTSAL